MRLVDADKMKGVLGELQKHSIDGKMNIESALYLLSIQNTAYDVDKVVEELEIERFRSNYEQEELIYDRAIEIVKAGMGV